MEMNEAVTHQVAVHDNAGIEVFARWAREAEQHWRAADYHWMASYTKGERVLEVGCGAGYSTLALSHTAASVLVVEPWAQCRAHTTQLLMSANLPVRPTFIDADIRAIDSTARSAMDSFSPTVIVCWLMGSADRPSTPLHEIQGERLAIHRKVGELAAQLPSVSAVHFADRTAFPWKLKNVARETLTRLHNLTTFIDLPFSCIHEDVRFRKLDELSWIKSIQRNSLGIVPCIGMAVAKRRTESTPLR